MNACRVGTGSPLQPPIAITGVPDKTSSAAADCEPLVAADHSVVVFDKTPARSELLPSSPIQLPSCASPFFSAVGIAPWCGVAAVAIENAVVPAKAASTPTATATAALLCAPRPSAAMAEAIATAKSAQGNQVGPKALRCSSIADHAAVMTISAASMMRPSQAARYRQPHTAPMPARAATAGAMATV